MFFRAGFMVPCMTCLASLLAPAVPGVWAAPAQQKIAAPKTRPTAKRAAPTVAPVVAPVAAPAKSSAPDALTNVSLASPIPAGAPSEPCPSVPSEPRPDSAAPAQPPRSVPADLDQPLAWQGADSVPLADHPQKVMFVKSQSASAKEAIADILLGDIGLNLITMGLASQMQMWNPYVGDALAKARAIGRGLLHSKGVDTQGFEYAVLPGATSNVTLRAGRPELLIPIVSYLPSAEVDLANVQPVLLRLEVREQEGTRLLTARHVLLKQAKKGRFDFKPTVERQESALEQVAIPADVELIDNRVYRVMPKEDLAPGEYALVFRKKAESGALTDDFALRPTPQAAAPASEEAQMGGMGDVQAKRRGGVFGISKFARPPAAAPSTETSVAGFVAFDFRVMR